MLYEPENRRGAAHLKVVAKNYGCFGAFAPYPKDESQSERKASHLPDFQKVSYFNKTDIAV